MTISKMIVFLRTPWGRFTNLMLAAAIFNLSSCTVYKAADTSMDTVRMNDQVMAHLDVYKFFVHDDYNSYLLSNPVFGEDGGISGTLILTTYQTPDSTWSRQDKKEYWKNHKYDINIYSNTVLNDLKADVNGGAATVQTVNITGGMIEKMTITSIDMEGELAGVALAMLIVLGVIVLMSLLIVLLAVALNDGGDASSDGSDSGSNSGGSDSGSSG